MYQRKDFGDVYFARRIEDGTIKIGFSAFLSQRMFFLESRYGEMDLLASMPGNRITERLVHLAFSDSQIKKGTELFRPDESLLEFIQLGPSSKMDYLEDHFEEIMDGLLGGERIEGELSNALRMGILSKEKDRTRRMDGNSKIYGPYVRRRDDRLYLYELAIDQETGHRTEINHRRIGSIGDTPITATLGPTLIEDLAHAYYYAKINRWARIRDPLGRLLKLIGARPHTDEEVP